MIIIKRSIGFICILFLLLLVACEGNENEQRDEVELLSEKEYNETLVNNDDIAIELLGSKHERGKELDTITLRLAISNKQNRTFEYSFRNVKLDGYDDVMLGMTVHEVGPNETIDIDVSAIDTDEISFTEYIGGEFHYGDYEDQIQSKEEVFSEYIN